MGVGSLKKKEEEEKEKEKKWKERLILAEEA